MAESQQLDRILELVERNSTDIQTLTTTVGKNSVDIEKLTGTVSNLAASVEKGFAAVAEDIADLNDKFDHLSEKVDRNHTELRSKLSGLEHRLDQEASDRQDQRLPVRVAYLEVKTFGASRAPVSAA